ncbi:DUF559 domain-containing protein [Paenibacillus sp. FSL R5-0744]|uniref:DUF559 domain-containing protein n=1 Tax=Paenibacillus sp. FSL R5-0744 TaxID=2921656 RepID=UPI0030DCB1C8
MKYKDLTQEEKWYVNGVLGKYMDKYVRDHLVWTPEQMYSDFIDYLTKFHEQGWYGKQFFENGVGIYKNKKEELWMVSEGGREHIMDSFTRKYNKNQKLARKKGPLVDRVRLGYRWDNDSFFDFGYGLQSGTHNYKKAEIVEGETLIPWTIAHVNHELERYGTNLEELLIKFSKSPIEKHFYKYWLNNYTDDESLPALVPEVCGTREMFWTQTLDGMYYLNMSHIPKNNPKRMDAKATNVRFDFMLVNWYKQKKLLIELDGHDYHKTVEQRSKDAVKRAIATSQGFQLNVFTGTQVTRNVSACFDTIKDFLSKR